MSGKVDLYHDYYSHFEDDVYAAVRRETFDEDIGQNSWLTAPELRSFIDWLALSGDDRLLEVACGSGGPACFVVQTTGCSLTGIDNEAAAVAAATARASSAGISERAKFLEVDANGALPFDDGSFDALLCVDAMNHLADRRAVLEEWYRVLRPGGAAVFTDPVVVTGAVTSAEFARRASIGFFLFVPTGYNERVLQDVGFIVERAQDATAPAADVSSRRHRARARHRAELVAIEGPEQFAGVQDFLQSVHDLSASRRLSRFAYHATKPAAL